MAGVDDILARYEPAAAPAPGGGVDDILARFGAPAVEEEVAPPVAPAPSGATSALRGLKQGLTLGFGDEIQGALAAAFSDETYREARDKARAADEASKEAHPWLFGGGNLVGGAATALIPGLNIAKGATMAATAGRAALAGGLAGLGESKAELGEGEYGRAALDTAAGAAIGGALGAAGHAVGKAVRGAPARAEAAELAGLQEGVQNSTKVRVFGPRGRNEPAIKAVLRAEPAIKKAIERDPAAALPMVEAKVEKIGSRLDAMFAKAESAGQMVPTKAVDDAMAAVEASYRRTSATKALADAVQGARLNFRQHWGKDIAFSDLRAEVGAFAKQGFEGGPMLSVPAGKQLKRDISTAMREVLHDSIEQVASKDPALGLSRKILQSTNTEMTAWLRILDAVQEKATRTSAGAKTMSQMLRGAAKDVVRAGTGALDTGVLAPIVRNVPKAAATPIGAGFRALQQGTAATAPEAPGYAAAGLRAALLPDEEDEALATGTP
jgi:hypothetical protein